MKKPVIGFIGQGFIGRNYANDFDNRGYQVIRYAAEDPYRGNKELIKECDVVFIAVPTPTTSQGFDDSIVRKVVKLVGKGKIAVIKSTMLPGSTESIQKINPGIYILHSPEFLVAKNAAHDAAHPTRNIIGIPKRTPLYKKKARQVLSLLPKAPFEIVCSSREAELIKYAGNNFLYTKVLFMNVLYDLAMALGVKWDVIRDSMEADSRLGNSHFDPIHDSGRGAGGPCFIKDFAAFKNLYKDIVGDKHGIEMLAKLESKNVDLLLATQKDLGLLEGVYGKKILNKKRRTK